MSYSQLVVPKSPNRGTRLYRFLRAIWHDTRALLTEFRKPLFTIFVSVVVGGLVYGELHVYAGYDPPISMIDRPYTMIQLMIIETPAEYTRTPHQWYLIIFWYLQPLVGIYIVGQGAVDFGRLFFNRHERRSAWELAVAHTYRNHVVLVGAGHVGLRIARTLSQMGFELVAVDDDTDLETEEELGKLGIPVVAQDARTTTTLNHAGIQYARAVIVCTSNDHLNLEITMRARDLNQDVRIVTRMWDSRFAGQLKRFLNVEVLSASDLAAPVFAGSAVGIEITQTIKVGGEDYSMIKLTVKEGSFMESKTIDMLQEDENIDIVLHGLSGQEPVVHPDGSLIVRANDTLVLFAGHDKITDIVSRSEVRQKI